jgi:diadenosine tetraphosphate (Ap4A) HIT family hydrolase
MNTDTFKSVENFSAAFTAGLSDMLEHEGLGVFILVCANAGFDPQIQQALAGRLRQRFDVYSEQYREALRHGRALPDADDDVLVFLKIMAIGFNALQPTQRRAAGPWELQFNQLRAFRPPRMAHTRVESLHVPFNENGFHFNKPFLRKECFWSGELQGREVELLYNKFPFVDFHGLLVPQREHNAPQFLTHDDHKYMWRVSEELGETLPGVGFGYNAYGAFASVNHLHFQMFLRETPLPVQLAQWQHNGGALPYPSRVERYDNVEAAWRYIETMHRGGDSYNLLYLPGEIYCLPRRIQGSYQHAPWTGGFAWYEMSGGMVSFSHEDFSQLTNEMIGAEFSKLAL